MIIFKHEIIIERKFEEKKGIEKAVKSYIFI